MYTEIEKYVKYTVNNFTNSLKNEKMNERVEQKI